MSTRRLAEVRESVIREMTRVAIETGSLNLAQGLPDMDPPEVMLRAAEQALRSGRNQYTITWGDADLRRAVARRLGALYGIDADPDREVTITCGVSEALACSVLALAEPGDAVVLMEPAHENYLPSVRLAGAEPRWVSLEPPAFRLPEAALREAFADGKARLIIVNSPHNPTGRVLTEDELGLLRDLCVEHDAIAVTDEIYEHIVYEGRHVPLATLAGMQERTITISGLSKSFAATGWRIGWAHARPPLTDELRKVHDYLTICAPAPLQAAAAVALAELGSRFFEMQAGAYRARRDLITEVLPEAGFDCTPPEGSYYVMTDYRRFAERACAPMGDDVAFARWLAETRRVAVVPGSAFYETPDPGRRLVRFSFPKRLETLREVGRRLG